MFLPVNIIFCEESLSFGCATCKSKQLVIRTGIEVKQVQTEEMTLSVKICAHTWKATKLRRAELLSHGEAHFHRRICTQRFELAEAKQVPQVIFRTILRGNQNHLLTSVTKSKVLILQNQIQQIKKEQFLLQKSDLTHQNRKKTVF